MIEVALRHHVLNIDGIEEILGDRMYPNSAPQNVHGTRIVYSRISTPRVRHLGGGSGLASPRFQLSIFCNDTEVLAQLATLIREGFDTLHHTSIGPAGSEVFVKNVILEDERDGFESDQFGGQTGEYRKDLDFIIWHDESVPQLT